MRRALCTERRPNLLPPNDYNTVELVKTLPGAANACQHPVSWSNFHIGVFWQNRAVLWLSLLPNVNSISREVVVANASYRLKTEFRKSTNQMNNARSSGNSVWASDIIYSGYRITVLSTVNDHYRYFLSQLSIPRPR